VTPAPWTAVLFDLDGTIVDSAPGITDGFRHTLGHLGLPIPEDDALRDLIGPPILDSFRDTFGLSHEQAEGALAIYRPHYLRTGLFNATVFPGIEQVLARVHESGLPTSLATSKPESSATRVLVHFGLDKYFTVITGASESEERSAKADVVADALRRLTALGVDLSNPVMVGDRDHDINGAAANGIPTIIVDWGYGRPGEDTGAVAVVSTARELEALLLG